MKAASEEQKLAKEIDTEYLEKLYDIMRLKGDDRCLLGAMGWAMVMKGRILKIAEITGNES